ncbi:MAG: hypothetical protein KC613_16490 [Myxococcales bacterium]|nr:hypothetical protein [Myxococcales bacterium]
MTDARSALVLDEREGRLVASEPDCPHCGGEGTVTVERPIDPIYANLPHAVGATQTYQQACVCAPARAAARRITGAHLPYLGPGAGFERFVAYLDLGAEPELGAQVAAAVDTARAFVARLGAVAPAPDRLFPMPDFPPGLVIAGGPLAGKTRLLAAVGLEAAQAGQRVRFLAWRTLAQLWSEPAKLNFDPVTFPGLLLIDDLDPSHREVDLLHFVNQRTRHGPTALTVAVDTAPEGALDLRRHLEPLTRTLVERLTSGGVCTLRLGPVRPA